MFFAVIRANALSLRHSPSFTLLMLHRVAGELPPGGELGTLSISLRHWLLIFFLLLVLQFQRHLSHAPVMNSKDTAPTIFLVPGICSVSQVCKVFVLICDDLPLDRLMLLP